MYGARQRSYISHMIQEEVVVGKYVVIALTFIVPACDVVRSSSETNREVCRQIGGALPTRSHQDTDQTIDEITVLYATFSLTCPEWQHLIPGES